MSTQTDIVKRRQILITIAVVLAMGLVLFFHRFGGDRLPPPELVRRFAVFGTVGEIKLWQTPMLTAASEAAEEVIDYFEKLHHTINVFDPESELSQLNQTAYEQPVECSDMLWDILIAAKQAHQQTDGLFDVTIGSLMQLWGFYQERHEWPSEQEVQQALEPVGMEQITFYPEDQAVSFGHPDTRIDLGGIAKGYALDQAVEILRRHGITTGIVNLGGDLVCLEAPHNTPGYKIGIRDPQQPGQHLDEIIVQQAGVATSGDYLRFREIEGRTVGHIVNPKTGITQTRVLSVTVIAPTALEAEIQATAIVVGGLPKAEEWVRQAPDRQVIIAYRDQDDIIQIEYLPENHPPDLVRLIHQPNSP